MSILWQLVRWVGLALGSLIGVWSPPRWLRWTVHHLGHGLTRLATLAQASPLSTLLGLGLFAALIWGGQQGHRWWQARPAPVQVTLSVTPPPLPDFAASAPAPQPVVITFSAPVAPLAQVGKALTSGMTMQPAIAGTWTWVDDRHLSFLPQIQWPAGLTYKTQITRGILVPQARMASLELQFTSTAFVPEVAKQAFYQDPVNPHLKKAVFEFKFTHPVDPVEFEKRLELRMADQAQGVMGLGRETTPLTVTYDKTKLNAYVHSANLAMPKENTPINLRLAEGVMPQVGGVGSAAALTSSVNVPGLYSFGVAHAQINVLTNERFEPEQVLMLETSHTVHEGDFAKQVSAWVLPKYKPGTPKEEQGDEAYAWDNMADITDAVLAQATKLALSPVASEAEHSRQHAFKFKADVGRVVFVRAEPKAKSFGGYLMGARDHRVLKVPNYPPELRILSQGALLPLSGEKKMAVLVRDLPGIKVELGRVQSGQLHHLVSQSKGEFASPKFLDSFGADNLTDRFERSLPLPHLKPGQTHYESIDLGSYLAKEGEPRRGLFFLTIKGYDPKQEEREKNKAHTDAAPSSNEPGSDQDEAPDEPQGEDGDGQASQMNPSDFAERRLVLVTDLGVVVKKSPDGSRDVFVQSLFTGLPASEASVEVVARNGTTLMTQTSDASGRVHFDKLDGLVRERAPMLITVRKGGDMSFIPLDRRDRYLDVSRFDVGGVQNARTAEQLNAYLFSDRGIYRPGESMHIGLIVKAADWGQSLAGLPLEVEVLDARGLVVKRERLRLAAGGFAEVSHTTLATSPTGNYTVNLNIVKNDKAERQLGSTVVRVQEFMPDTLKVTAQLSSPPTPGWVHPKDLKGHIHAQNLFGTPAENRKVELSMNLNPALPTFRQYPDFVFFDPQRAAERTNDELPPGVTDTQGELDVDLKLSRFTKATYRLNLLAKVFEPGDAGRSVSAQTSALVSELPYLVGVKHDGPLGYVAMGAKRISQVLAIDPQAKPVAVPGLRVQFVERRTVSVLLKQPNDTYKYESRKKEMIVSEQPLALAAQGHAITLDTQKAGNYSYVLRDVDGLELNRIDYSVQGQGNVSRSLERNAELQLALNKTDYAVGDEIEVSIRAPYVGAGLITIERDKVFTQQWFKTTTTASVQKIKLPKDFEGNGYVSVQFLRDPTSDEIFMSPLSHGVVPFATSLKARTQTLKISAPELTKPGQAFKIKLTAAQPTRAVVFAVDEGILQVAGYKTPDPLGHFFQKRALEVKTSQILDLLLPEFKRLMAQSAPGGDQGNTLARFLNPFKRRGEAAAVYWSGLVDVQGEREVSVAVPEHFNGSLRLMAVAVNEGALGVAQSNVQVRGDFVMTPNLPLAASPGDVFEVSVGVANNVAASTKDAPVQLTLKAPTALEVVGETTQTLKISPMREAVATYRLRVKDSKQVALGSATLEFTSSLGDKTAKRHMDISVRPATPRSTTVTLGAFKGSTEVIVPRDLAPELRHQDVALSTLPLAMAPGLMSYLHDFPHQCTEQLVSRVFPALLLAKHPEFGVSTPQLVSQKWDEALHILRSRQNAQGGFGLWGASVEPDEFASLYAMHMLIEARELELPGVSIPTDMLNKSLGFTQQLAATHPDTLAQARNRAYAIYLLTRQGTVTTSLVATLRETLNAKFAKTWPLDATAAYLAGTYQLLKQDKQAGELIGPLIKQMEQPDKTPYQWTPYYDPLVRNTFTLYALARHFPDRLKALDADTISRAIEPLTQGRFNSLSSSYSLMAFEAMARTLGADATRKISVSQLDAKGQATPLALPENLLPKAAVVHGTAKLKLLSDTKLNTYYSLTQSGFDRDPPKDELKAGIEVLREYLDANGQPVTTVKVGQDVTVRLSLRAVSGHPDVYNVVLTDLLPGGFEVVQSRDAQGTNSTVTGTNLVFADVREDRVLIYTHATNQVQMFHYKVRATNLGTFTIPPAYAESMYERDKMARSVAGRMTVQAAPSIVSSPK